MSENLCNPVIYEQHALVCILKYIFTELVGIFTEHYEKFVSGSKNNMWAIGHVHSLEGTLRLGLSTYLWVQKYSAYFISFTKDQCMRKYLNFISGAINISIVASVWRSINTWRASSVLKMIRSISIGSESQWDI